jgi:hypothetical protein
MKKFAIALTVLCLACALHAQDVQISSVPVSESLTSVNTADLSSLYFATSASSIGISRVNQNDLSQKQFLQIPGASSISALALDPAFAKLYAVIKSASNSYSFVDIDVSDSTITIVNTVSIGAISDDIADLVADNSYVYLLTKASQYTLTRYNRTDFTQSGSITAQTGSGGPMYAGTVFDTRNGRSKLFVIVSYDGSNYRVDRIANNDMTTLDPVTVTLPGSGYYSSYKAAFSYIVFSGTQSSRNGSTFTSNLTSCIFDTNLNEKGCVVVKSFQTQPPDGPMQITLPDRVQQDNFYVLDALSHESSADAYHINRVGVSSYNNLQVTTTTTDLPDTASSPALSAARFFLSANYMLFYASGETNTLFKAVLASSETTGTPSSSSAAPSSTTSSTTTAAPSAATSTTSAPSTTTASSAPATTTSAPSAATTAAPTSQTCSAANTSGGNNASPARFSLKFSKKQAVVCNGNGHCAYQACVCYTGFSGADCEFLLSSTPPPTENTAGDNNAKEASSGSKISSVAALLIVCAIGTML